MFPNVIDFCLGLRNCPLVFCYTLGSGFTGRKAGSLAKSKQDVSMNVDALRVSLALPGSPALLGFIPVQITGQITRQLLSSVARFAGAKSGCSGFAADVFRNVKTWKPSPT